MERRFASADAPSNHWYRLLIPPEELQFSSFARVRRWEEIAAALFKKYFDRYFKHRKQEWESGFYKYYDVGEGDPSLVAEYRLLNDGTQNETIDRLLELKKTIESGAIADSFLPNDQGT